MSPNSIPRKKRPSSLFGGIFRTPKQGVKLGIRKIIKDLEMQQNWVVYRILQSLDIGGYILDLLDVVGFVYWPHHHMVQAFLAMLCRQSNPEDLKNKYLSGPLLVSKRLSIKTPSILGSFFLKNWAHQISMRRLKTPVKHPKISLYRGYYLCHLN